MTDASNPIRVGSYIHLKNNAPNGGYLEVRAEVEGQDELSRNAAEDIGRLVFTHEDAKRDEGSGSWLVLSVEGSAKETQIYSGDKVYLWNPSGGYLGSFGNVTPGQASQPDFIDQIQTGVFKRRPIGDWDPFKWTIHSATMSPDEQLFENDVIYLQNEKHLDSETGAGYLDTGGLVTQHEQFHGYDGQPAFVFASTAAGDEPGSDLWTITLGRYPETAYYQLQFQPDDSTGPWDRSSRLKIRGLSRLNEPILALKFTSDDDGKTLAGTVTYVAGKIVNASGTVTQIDGQSHNFKATRLSEGRYDYAVEIEADHNGASEWVAVGRWHLGLGPKRWNQFGGYDYAASENIVAMNITSPDNGHTFTGTMSYAGENPAGGILSIASEDGTVEQFISGGTITVEATIEKAPFYGNALRIEDDYGKGWDGSSNVVRSPIRAFRPVKPVGGGVGPHVRGGGPRQTLGSGGIKPVRS